MTPSSPLTVIYLRTPETPSGEEAIFGACARRAGGAFRAVESFPPATAPQPDPGTERLVVVSPLALLAETGRPPEGWAAIGLRDPGESADRPEGTDAWLAAVLDRPVSEGAADEALCRAGAQSALLLELRALREVVSAQGRELQELNRIGVALSAERSVDRLLEMILSKCREITSADAGSLYLVEKKEGAAGEESDDLAGKDLVFKLAQNDSVPVAFSTHRMEISRKSLAGFVVLTGEPLAIDDAYAIPPDCEYEFNRSFDEASGYRTRSLLVIPMRNHREEIIGALQLINRKRDSRARLNLPGAVDEQAIPFDARSAGLASSLASQAAVAIENARLYQDIQALFEGFIRASVTAIESRDPTTSGHSERVARLTVGLAEKVDREGSGPLAGIRFTRTDIREIQYASLLHDFGKIGVREDVLLKGKKLYPDELEAVKARFRYVRRSLELDTARRKLALHERADREQAVAGAKVLDAELAARLADIDRYLQLVLEANEPTVLRREVSVLLRTVEAASFSGPGGEVFRLLEPEEAENLSIEKGSLSLEERREIESHVTHTYEFLATIPWTRELSQVPRIAGAHHEKLDGSGYPRGIGVREIPLQSKIMTISDIFDALTARDRPYKKAMASTRALDILASEVKEGKIDGDLFRIFVDSRVYEKVLAPEESALS
ncbi:MAG TPA: HD domain-containing phosphohydrolase [Candidatus Saccharimonadales bacterium]|nr:HD domain-containing phosphohydrolase [Candidatus Saccharimonadales bacterium]